MATKVYGVGELLIGHPNCRGAKTGL